MRQKIRYHSIAGLSLVELMISMAIGLVVVAAVLVNYLTSNSAGRYQAVISQMNQDAQVALNLLSHELQLAGYSQPVSLINVSGGGAPDYVISYNVDTATAIFGCDSASGSVPFKSPTAAVLSCADTGASTVSAFEVTYQADNRNTVPRSDGKPTDCLGQAAVNVGGTYYRVRNRYFINTSAAVKSSHRPELYCASDAASGTMQPLIENVEDMQVWYGIAANPSSRQVIRYVRAGKDATTPSTINAVGATEWANVISVRICLLMRSAEPVASSEDNLNYLDCNSVSQTSADRLMRRAYYTTATLRSRMPY